MNCCQFFRNCYDRLRLQYSPYKLAMTPKHTNRKVLVLDLDETLVHCEFKENPNFNYETILEVYHKNQLYKVYLRRRPYLTEFLQRMSQLYEIVIFTAGYEAYCEKVLQYIDADRTISDYYARSYCQFVDGQCFKDLTILERPLENLIFIDNNPMAFDLQPQNGLLIPSFLDSDEDDCLSRLVPFLTFMATRGNTTPLSDHVKHYEKTHGALFMEQRETALGEEVEENLSEGRVIKVEDEEFELRHRKTQTLVDQSLKKSDKQRSATLFAG